MAESVEHCWAAVCVRSLLARSWLCATACTAVRMLRDLWLLLSAVNPFACLLIAGGLHDGTGFLFLVQSAVMHGGPDAAVSQQPFYANVLVSYEPANGIWRWEGWVGGELAECWFNAYVYTWRNFSIQDTL